MKILIVEDHQDVAANMWDYFEARGHVIDHAPDGQSGLRRAMSESFDVILLDLGLPRLDGLKLCRALRDAGRGVPIIMVTARDQLDDKIRGFAEGADDYLVKPFSLRELDARIHAIVERRHLEPNAVVKRYGLELDTGSYVVRREGRTIGLTRTQIALLYVLMRAAPKVVSRESLASALASSRGDEAAALNTHMHALRALIDRPFAIPLIHTIHGVGYRIEGPE